MKLRNWFKISCFFFLIIFLGCTDDTVPENELSMQEIQANESADSILINLSDKQEYYQHFILEVPLSYQENLDSLANWIVFNEPGGLNFRGWDADSVSKLKSRLDTLSIIQPIYFANYFDFLELPEYPFWQASQENRNEKWQEIFTNDRIGMIEFGASSLPDPLFTEWIEKWHEKSGIQFLTNSFSDKFIKRDFDLFFKTLPIAKHLVKLELSAYDTIQLNPLRSAHQFEGIFLSKVDKKAANRQLKGGADYIYLKLDENSISLPFADWKISDKEREDFKKSSERILRAKQKLIGGEVLPRIKEKKSFVKQRLLAGSTTVITNKSDLIPFKSAFKIYADENLKIDPQIKSGLKCTTYLKDINLSIDKIAKESGTKLIVLPDTLCKEAKIALNKIKKSDNTIICFSNPDNFSFVKNTPNLVFYLNRDNQDYSVFLQQLVGNIAIEGDFVAGDSLKTGVKFAKLKLARTQPSFCGLSKDSLQLIDQMVSTAMAGKAFPGCQVLVAKDGCIVYDKSFGKHAYDGTKLVTPQSLYDVASLTKVVATTMVGMLLYDLKGYKITDSLHSYLPDSLREYLKGPSTLANITFRELFVHKSGLPSGIPIMKYMNYTNNQVGRFDKFYCDRPDSAFSVEVAENFYLEACYLDSLWVKLNQTKIDPSKAYKYSDVNMNVLYLIFKSILHSNPSKFGYRLSKNQLKNQDLFAKLLYDKLYLPLGMNRTKYRPLDYFDKNEIVPSENETFWRKQVLQGYVHDPNAALYGGIAGNAGIFTTANDLAILGELLLQKGTYNGTQYIAPETVTLFTSSQPNSFRGLGFNKPSINTAAFGCADSAPMETYGHTGFTGTCIWMDPVNHITYIFLANRVYPKVNNRIYQYGIRKRAHQMIYEAML
jgi:CubicO group peptidase (beta-lactamase class C family)